MKLTLPEFAQGIHYTELKGSSPESNRTYRFKLLADVSLRVPKLAQHEKRLSFRDVDRREWAEIRRDLITVRVGYAWNGSSPKWWVPLLGWVGTPDPEPTRLATLFHDVSFQFLRTAGWPLPIVACNDLFCSIMTQQGFRWAETYFGAVTDFGERFAGKYPKRGEHSFDLGA